MAESHELTLQELYENPVVPAERDAVTRLILEDLQRPVYESMKSWTNTVLSQLAGHKLNRSLPLDIQATAFQRRVWAHLQSLPFGATQSYGQVAKAIGKPTAARAVARACASNRIAFAIPCHRVVRGNGEMGGYRWGTSRKKALLEMERQASPRRSASADKRIPL